MPRYMFETPLTDDDAGDRAARLAAQRFPEVALEHRYAVHDDGSHREVWVCRAPSVAHVRRWAGAAGVTLWVLRHVDGDGGSPQPEAGPG